MPLLTIITCTVLLFGYLALLRCCDRTPINCPCNPCQLGFRHGGEYHYAMASEFTTERWIESCRRKGFTDENLRNYLRQFGM